MDQTSESEAIIWLTTAKKTKFLEQGYSRGRRIPFSLRSFQGTNRQTKRECLRGKLFSKIAVNAKMLTFVYYVEPQSYEK